MIRYYRTLKSSNKAIAVLFLLAIHLPLVARAQFKSDRDKKIVHDILSTFARECVQREATDNETLKRLEVEAKDSGRIANSAPQKCYENNFSQLTGVFYLYQKICRDVSAKSGEVSDSIAANQLYEVNHYQTGIRPFHSALNDCLTAIPDKRGLPFIVPLAGMELDAKVLEKELNQIKIGDPFPALFPVPAR